MTIIKVSKDGKLIAKKKVYEETTVPLTPGGAEVGMRVEYSTPQNTKRMVNIFLLLIALLVLTSGIVGAVFLYRYMAHRHKMEHVVIPYKDQPRVEAVHSQTQPQQWHKDPALAYTMEEDIDIFVEEDLERIEVPRFDECRKSIVMHDFRMNYSVIVDVDDNECFIMELDREKMKPPRTFSELIRRYVSGYYMPNVDVIRHDYTVVTPKLANLDFAGRAIATECLGMDSYMLEKKADEWLELEVDIEISYKTYGYSNLEQVIKERIRK